MKKETKQPISPNSFWATQMGHKDNNNQAEWDNDSWATQRG